MLLGDLIVFASLASQKQLDRVELSIFRPIKCMLATPEPTAEAIWERFSSVEAAVPGANVERNPPRTADATVFVEDKFDGIRAQLHRNSKRAEIYSRDLRLITDQFHELAEHARQFDVDLILDGEIVAFELGRKLTFFDLQKRLGRETDGADLFASAAADNPVAFIAFHLLWLDCRALLKNAPHVRWEAA